MANTYTQIYLHIVFSVKSRLRLIPRDFQSDMHAYIWKTLEGLGHTPIAVGGIDDHVHILLGYNIKMTIPDTVQRVKSHSSKVFSDNHPGGMPFRWQTGYGCFSVSPSHRDVVAHYINNQREHHQSGISFREEIEKIFGKYQITYDEKYLPIPED